ncbi:hypothetical protein [Alkalimarinus sediminis]|uniref:Curlin associated repeat-containing protein n=1 Tax=Alkalimarinus sediminis TaxID=1632866 RepID=A0A9E8KRC2_9ALTE|nr:hypothetical protein [Alkalimarinus sediminis]UZW76190.1 hypothetical protein NNL22_06320 [Alkalimarinus sediminis]
MSALIRSSTLITLLLLSVSVTPPLSADVLDDELGLSNALVSDQELESHRGRADLDLVFQTNDSDQNALMQQNTLHSEGTGSNTISGNAFSGMSGIATVIQNTGNQVIIQDTTMVNVLINQ